MRPFPYPVAVALALLTALALLGVAAAIRPPGLPGEVDSPAEAANRAVAVAFYDAANAAIATGDPAPFTALVAPDFVDQTGAPEPGLDRDRLIQRLLAIHAAAPGARLESTDMVADGELVIASVRVSGATSPTFAGLPLDLDWSAWGSVDVLRIAGGRIVERRGESGDPAPPMPLIRVALDLPWPATRTLIAARMTLAPGARYDAPSRSGARFVLVEAGAVAVSASEPGATTVTLTTGDHLALPPDAVTIRQVGPTPAVVLDVALVVPPYFGDARGQSAMPASRDGLVVRLVSPGLAVEIPAGRTVLTVGRATIESGQSLDWEGAAGPVVIHVEAGEVHLDATGAVPYVRAVADERSNGGIVARLAANGLALFEAGAAVQVRVTPAEPATILVISLTPDTAPV